MINKIEVLDKVNNTNYIIPKPEFVFHPINDTRTDLKELDEYIDLKMEIAGVIFKIDGSTIILYEKGEK